MKKLIIIISYIFIQEAVKAQGDTVVQYYPSLFNAQTTIFEAHPLSENRLLLQKIEYSIGHSMLLVNEEGITVEEAKIDSVDDFEIIGLSCFFERSNEGIVVCANAKKQTQNYFIVFQIDFDLTNISLIDSISVGAEAEIYFRDFKPVFNQSDWEAVVFVNDKSIENDDHNAYIKLNESYQISQFQLLSGDYPPDSVFDFLYIPQTNQYIASLISHELLIIKPNFEVVEYWPAFYRFENGNIHYNEIYDCINAYLGADGAPTCYARQYFDDFPEKHAIITLNTADDTTIVEDVNPLNSPSLHIQYFMNMRRDTEGNIIICGVNHPPASSATNSIAVAKFSPSFERIWYLQYQNEYSYVIRDLELSSNGDIAIVGDAVQNQNKIGFLLKIKSDGTLGAYHDLPPAPASIDVEVFPNPTQGEFCLRSNTAPVVGLALYDWSGRKIAEYRYEGRQTEICEQVPPHLPSGGYPVEIRFADGRTIRQKVAVVR